MTRTVYTATVIGEGPVNGETVRMVLGYRRMISSELALSWLRGQAHRIADGLDPDPRAPWLSGRVLHQAPPGLPDVPNELRRWCSDDNAQRAARDQLRLGSPLTVNTADHTGLYSLTVWPVPEPAPSPSHSPTPPEFRPGRRRPCHRKPRRKRGRLGTFFRWLMRAHHTVTTEKATP